MKLTTIAQIKNQNEVFDKLGFAVTKLWNTANYQRRQTWEETGKIPNYFRQCKELKDNYWARQLHSQTVQKVLSQLDESYKSWYQLRKKDKSANPPGFRRKNEPSAIPFKKEALKVIDSNYIRLPFGRTSTLGKEYILEFKSHIPITQENIRGLNLVKYNGKWCAHIRYEANVKPLKIEGKVKAIDLGIIHTAATVNEDGEIKIYTGKGALSTQRHFNKQIAKVQIKSMKQNKQKWSGKLGRMSDKKRKQIKHFLHAVSRSIVDDCLNEGINRVVVGDLKNIRKEKNYGKKVNQKLHAWGFKEFTDQLKYKLELEGIQLIEVGERNTSKTCSQCGYKESYKGQCRKHRGLYVCRSCGAVINADVNGSLNILKKYLPEANVSWSSGCLAQPLVSRWSPTGAFDKCPRIPAL